MLQLPSIINYINILKQETESNLLFIKIYIQIVMIILRLVFVILRLQFVKIILTKKSVKLILK